MPYPRWRTAVVTGASRGIGRALAEVLAEAGVQVWLLARSDDALAEVAEGIRARHGTVFTRACDLRDADAAAHWIRKIDAECGGLELLIANAGVGLPAPDAVPYAWESIAPALQTNFVGAAATLTAALPAMIARGRGHLVATGSLASYGALPGSAAYCAPKAGLDMLLECLRLDLHGTGVHVTNLRLGFVRTRMVEQSTHPMPQMLEPRPLAEAVVERLARAPAEIILPRALGYATRAFGGLPRSLREPLVRRMLPPRE